MERATVWFSTRFSSQSYAHFHHVHPIGFCHWQKAEVLSACSQWAGQKWTWDPTIVVLGANEVKWLKFCINKFSFVYMWGLWLLCSEWVGAFLALVCMHMAGQVFTRVDNKVGFYSLLFECSVRSHIYCETITGISLVFRCFCSSSPFFSWCTNVAS